MNALNVMIFIALYLYLANWTTVKLLMAKLIKAKNNIISLNDQRISTYLRKKTGLDFTIKLVKSGNLFGMSTGLPMKPWIFLSTEIYRKFKKDELEWLLLHEAGHIVLWHPLLIGLLQLVFLIIGVIILRLTGPSTFLTLSIPFMAILLASSYYQINRKFVELAADNYAVKMIDDPKGMITANEQMRKKVTSIFYKNRALGFLFTPHPTYDQRIKIAKAELNNRRNLSKY